MKSNIIKFIFVLAIISLLFLAFAPYKVNAATQDKDELVQLLNEFESELGDLKQLKVIVDNINNELNSATSVDQTLKDKLNAEVDKLNTVTGMNPLILNVLEIEIKSQISQADSSNIGDLKEEISVIKEWVDSKVPNDNTNDNNNTNKDNSKDDNKDNNNKPSNVIDNTVVKDKTLPQTGEAFITIVSIIALISFAVFCIVKYKQYKSL